MVWPGVGDQQHVVVERVVALDDLVALGGDDRQHRVVDPRTGRRSFFCRSVQYGELAIGEHILRLREGRHPAAVLEPRVPADMVDVQVRAHHVVDVVDAEAGGREVLLEAVALHHVPERPRRPRLVVADAGVDQDVVVRRLDHVALDAEHHLARCRIEAVRLAARSGSPRAAPSTASERIPAASKNGASCSTTRWIVMSLSVMAVMCACPGLRRVSKC